MFRRLRYALPALLCIGLSGPAFAQQGGAYIDQIGASSPSRSQANRPTAEEILATWSGNGSVAFNAPPQIGNTLLIPTPGAPLPNLGQVNNLAVLNQIGGNNTGTIDQTGTGNAAVATVIGSNNITTQTQVGNDSVSALILLGNQNTITAAQNGDRNNYALNVGGSGNTISHAQNGNDLSFGLTVLGRGANISITQAPSATSPALTNPSQATILPSTSRR